MKFPKIWTECYNNMTCSLHNNSTLYRKPSIEFSLNSSCNLNSPHPILERRKLTSRHVTLSIKLIFDSLLLCFGENEFLQCFCKTILQSKCKNKNPFKKEKTSTNQCPTKRQHSKTQIHQWELHKKTMGIYKRKSK